MSGTLLKRELKINGKLLALFLAVLTLYGGMITSMFDPKLGESLKAMADSMPDLFSAFGMNQSGATLTEFLSNYLYGFLLVVFPMVFLILLANRLLTRYLDRGSIAFLLATPNRRSKLALTQAFVMVLLLFCLTLYMTGLLLGLSAALFPGELDCGAFLLLNAGLFGLYLFLSGLCFCTACLWSEPRLATGVGAGACIAFVLLQMLSRVGEKFEWLKYATPLTLFDPQGLIGGEPSAVWRFLLLYTGGLALYGVGIAVFCRRDIPA